MSAIPTVIHLHVVERLARVRSRRGEPVTLGLPLPKGLRSASDGWCIVAGSGLRLPLQVRVLDRWSDGSIRWALLDFQVPGSPAQSGPFSVHLGGTGASDATADRPGLTLRAEPGVVTVDTGVTRFRSRAGSAFLFDEIVGTSPLLDCARSELRFVEAGGNLANVKWSSVMVEEAGPLRACIRAGGTAAGRGFELELVARLHFYAGLPVARLLLSVRNPRRAAHPGGIWELGDAGSALIEEMSLLLAQPKGSAPRRICWSVAPGEPLCQCGSSLEIYQESSGGENWRSRAHLNRDGHVPLRFRGYSSRADGSEASGDRSTPVVAINGSDVDLAGAFPEFWQNFPRAIEATPDSLRLSFFPRRFPCCHEIQGGEQKTHEVFLLFGKDPVTDVPLDWCRSPLLAHASPEWYAASDAVPFLTPGSDDPHEKYLALVDAALDGENAFLQKRERQDEYGWRNFGDIVADHEAVLSPHPENFVSHYNNQYDAAYGFGIHFMRTGDPRWWSQMDELTRHVVDIDIYHTDEDKAAYNRGLFWHTYHYVEAGLSTHRSYPRAPGVSGGGPSNEHDYSAGLLLHHLLTGNEASREAVLELARWAIDMDDGRKTVFRWLDSGPTGLASQTGSPSYHGPGRGASYSITTLLNAYTLTRDSSYLEKAESLMRRCIHPDDDIAALNLLDAERRWYYTVFLQALGKYLHFKAEAGQLDWNYAWGRASLLHYARWMVEHEYPYLDKPEILEYPNETWPAQDMRKCEVFQLASLHAADDERQVFLEKARFFFDYSVSTLSEMPTRGLARPVVLLLSNGYSKAWLERNPSASLPPATESMADFGRREDFEPQKARALRRAKALAGAAGVAALAAGAAVLVHLLG